MGIAKINELDGKSQLVVSDRKNTGFVDLEIKNIPKNYYSDESFLIIEKENKMPIIFTLHPGEPISPSKMPINKLKVGTIISKKKALKLGFRNMQK